MKPHPSPFTNQDSILQVSVGRWQEANILDHPQQVLAHLSHQPWEAVSQQGITWVYLLGLFDNRGEIIVDQEEGVDLERASHRLPSTFALSNHAAIHPILGLEADAIALVQRLQQAGLKVMVDFVPNHTGLSHPWIQDHPDFYHFHDGQLVKEFSGDVAKLNYDNPQLRQEMNQVLTWIQTLGVDGVRCDMAHLVPTAFWHQAISSIQEHQPHFAFVAEAYVSDIFQLQPLEALVEAGFDRIYHEPLYRNLKQVLTQHQPLNYVAEHLTHTLQANQLPWLNYVSNHDDPFPSGESYWQELLALILLLPQPCLVFNGALQGFTCRLSHHSLELLELSALDFNSLPPRVAEALAMRRSDIHLTQVKLDGTTLIGKLNSGQSLELLTVLDYT